MQESDIVERIKALCESRSWTFYRLAKASGITYSTLCTTLHKSASPSIPTLIKICNGFGISLSEFFDDNDVHALLTETQKDHLRLWDSLSVSNKAIVSSYIRFLLSEQETTQ